MHNTPAHQDQDAARRPRLYPELPVPAHQPRYLIGSLDGKLYTRSDVAPAIAETLVTLMHNGHDAVAHMITVYLVRWVRFMDQITDDEQQEQATAEGMPEAMEL